MGQESWKPSRATRTRIRLGSLLLHKYNRSVPSAISFLQASPFFRKAAPLKRISLATSTCTSPNHVSPSPALSPHTALQHKREVQPPNYSQRYKKTIPPCAPPAAPSISTIPPTRHDHATFQADGSVVVLNQPKHQNARNVRISTHPKQFFLVPHDPGYVHTRLLLYANKHHYRISTALGLQT